jgi:hypothetical protein
MKWIKCSDELPPVDTWVIACDMNVKQKYKNLDLIDEVDIQMFESVRGWRSRHCSCCHQPEKPTHWAYITFPEVE